MDSNSLKNNEDKINGNVITLLRSTQIMVPNLSIDISCRIVTLFLT